MTRKDNRPDGKDELRKRAEETVREKAAKAPENREATPEETRRILHELQVHQIELTMQNEELHRAQAELEASRARYVDLYDFAPVGYVTVSEAGMVLEANLTAASLLGLPRGAIVRQPLPRFILPGDQDIYFRHRARLFETGKPQVCELRLQRTDNPPLWVRLDATAATEESGTPVCRVVMSDISQRKQADAEREKLQAQFNQAQKMESVGRLAGGVAHDFNNMLQVILSNAEMAMDQVEPSKPLHGYLREIRKSAERSAELTRQLLAFARKQIIVPRVLDLNQTVDGMLKMLRRLIGEDIDIVWLPESGLWPVKIDPSQLDQVLANLCVHARDAIADEGKMTIETKNVVFDESYCAEHPEVVPGEFVLLTVSDGGCGMDRETLAKLFEPFFTTKEVGKGTGLGLAMIYGIVKQNSGFINVYSEPGQGTTFRIYLPRHEGTAERIRREDPLEPSDRGHETILLVEDEPAILKMAKMMLEGLGYTVLAATSPEEAIRLSGKRTGEIHLLVTDVIMPRMNGRELARNLLLLRPNLKRLFMSGYSADVFVRHGVLSPGEAFIQKPFSTKELARKVREALGEG